MNQKKTCSICGKPFIPNPRAHSQKYCSHRCYRIANNQSKHAKTKNADKPIRKKKQVMRNDFLTVPQAPNYEINSEGFIRNKTTGKFLKWFGKREDRVHLIPARGAKRISVMKNSILWFLHGRIIAMKPPVVVIVSKGNKRWRFDTATDCAKFLARVTNYTQGTARYYLSRRDQVIAGWNIEYVSVG